MGDYFFGEEVMFHLTGRQHSGFGDGVTMNERGLPPCWRAYFLLLRQKKVAKEKATPGAAPFGFLALLGRPGGLPELACGSDKASRLPPARLRCSAPSTGTRKASMLNRFAKKARSHGQPEKTAKNTILHSGTQAQTRLVSPCPLRGAEQRRLERKQGEGCLRAQPEFRSPRSNRVAQGTGAAGTDPGVAFSLATFFWPHKRKYARQQSGNPSQLAPRWPQKGKAQEKPRHA